MQACKVSSVAFNSLQSHGLEPATGSSVHGILQARILEWVAMPSSKGSSQPRDRTRVSYVPWIGREGSLALVPSGKPRWMDKENVVYLYNAILLNHKKEWNNAICSNIDGPKECHTKSVRRKTNTKWYHLYMEPKRNNTNELFTKQK